jgi:O-antigen ligase
MLILRAAPTARRAYIIAVILCVAVFLGTANDEQLARFGTIFAPSADYNVTDGEGRLQIWRRGVGYMVDHPLLGTGIESFETAEGVLSGKVNYGQGVRYTAAHNSFVEIGAELGVFGLVAFVAVLWFAGWNCHRIRQRAIRDHVLRPHLADEEARLASSAYCAIIGLAATAFFLSMAYHPLMFFALAVCAGVEAGSPYRRFSPPPVIRVPRSRAEWQSVVELARSSEPGPTA